MAYRNNNWAAQSRRAYRNTITWALCWAVGVVVRESVTVYIGFWDLENHMRMLRTRTDIVVVKICIQAQQWPFHNPVSPMTVVVS